MNTPATERTRLVAAHEDAAEFYRRMLLGPEGHGPRRYLTSRGFEALLDETRWAVGYAPSGWTRLRDHLGDLGYHDETLLAAGLTRLSRRGTPIDSFRDRITFGIRDLDHSLVGFTARCSPDAPAHVPKYLNTSRTAMYDKSRLLFALGQASEHRDALVISEGPLDAIAIDLSFRSREVRPTCVALCGTAITEHHRNTVVKLGATRVILAFDNDAAGASAREHTYRLLHGSAEIDAIELPNGADVAEVFKTSGSEGVRSILTGARPAIDAIIDDRLAAWPQRSENAEAGIACLRSLTQLLADLKPDDMARQAIRLRDSTNLPAIVVTRELAEAIARQ